MPTSGEGMSPSEGMSVSARVLVEGTAGGATLVLEEPLSFWGGLDPETGEIIDARHPGRGASVTGRVLVMPAGRGSSSSSSVLAEAIRLGTAPAAIVLGEADVIVALGAMAAAELYGIDCPVVVVDNPADYRRVSALHRLTIETRGESALLWPGRPGRD